MSVELFVTMLTNLRQILAKGAAHAEARKLEAEVLERSRLAPDMFSLARQVLLTCDFAKNSAARLAGVEPPRFEDTEVRFDELIGRVDRTLEYLRTLTPAQFEGAEKRFISVQLRTRKLEMDGLPFLQKWVLPNFYFHATTTYAILRHNGVDVGKQDFLGGV
jgi:hypothetical protein